MCQNCGPKKNVWFQKWCGSHTTAIGKRIPPFFLIPWRTRNLWSNTYMLDVSCGTLHEDIKRLCEKQSKAWREHGIRLCNRRGIKVLHKIITRLYNHKMKNVGWKGKFGYGWWSGWRKWVPMKNECIFPIDGPLFCPSKCWAMAPWCL
jgi:hypothetical protein